MWQFVKLPEIHSHVAGTLSNQQTSITGGAAATTTTTTSTGAFTTISTTAAASTIGAAAAAAAVAIADITYTTTSPTADDNSDGVSLCPGTAAVPLSASCCVWCTLSDVLLYQPSV